MDPRGYMPPCVSEPYFFCERHMTKILLVCNLLAMQGSTLCTLAWIFGGKTNFPSLPPRAINLPLILRRRLSLKHTDPVWRWTTRPTSLLSTRYLRVSAKGCIASSCAPTKAIGFRNRKKKTRSVSAASNTMKSSNIGKILRWKHDIPCSTISLDLPVAAGGKTTHAPLSVQVTPCLMTWVLLRTSSTTSSHTKVSQGGEASLLKPRGMPYPRAFWGAGEHKPPQPGRAGPPTPNPIQGHEGGQPSRAQEYSGMDAAI